MIGKPLESVEYLAGDDFLACAGDQPVIEIDGGAGIEKPTDADLGFPKSGFKFLPVFLVGVLDIGTFLKKALKNKRG